MFVTGPDVVKTVTHEEVTHEELGGAVTHTTKSGVADCAFENDVETLMMTRRLVNYLPGSNREKPPVWPTEDPADRDSVARHAHPGQPEQTLRHQGADPEGRRRGRVLRDPARSREEHRRRVRAHGGRAGRHRREPAARARRVPRHQELDQGRAVRALATASTSRSSPSSTCPASCRDGAGIRRDHQARREALFAYAEATVPKVTVITRKAYGGAYDVMSSKHLRGDVNFAWPSAEIAVAGPKARWRSSSARTWGSAEDRRAHRGVPAEVRQPVHRRAPRLHRRRDHAARDAAADLPVAGDAEGQAARQPVAQARQHPAWRFRAICSRRS